MDEPDNRHLKDYVDPSEDETYSSTVPPAIQTNTFKLKPYLLQIV